MDNLVLIRVVADLNRVVARGVLRGVRSEGPHRYSLRFEKADRGFAVVISLRPELPWLGRPVVRGKRGRGRSDPFAGTCARALVGGIVETIEKPGFDRVVVFRFSGGPALVAELATHGANLILLGLRGEVTACARHPRSSRQRLAVGATYQPPRLPGRLLVPEDADSIDARVEMAIREGKTRFEALRRRLFGVGSAGAALVDEESRRSATSVGTVLIERLDGIRAGKYDPVIEAEADPLALAREGRLETSGVRLLPWEPEGLAAARRWSKNDPPGTAGLYHEAVERAVENDTRLRDLASILDREIRRAWEVETRINADLRTFEDPDRYRVWGEALLAGLANARRSGGYIVVADPYSPDRDVVIPAPPESTLTDVAEQCFRKHRRAKRGLVAARERRERVQARRERLETVRRRFEDARAEDDAEGLEAAMRGEGIPVGLASRRRESGAAVRVGVEGVRVFRSSGGHTILVGRSGKGNDRLTFKIASSEDLWLHVLGRPGAHVVVRNPGKLSRECLVEAAGLAAWYSDARDEEHVDVQWTRRKNVRRVRGAAPGTVTVKRSETVRVRPSGLERGAL